MQTMRVLGFLCLVLPWGLLAQQAPEQVTATLDLDEKFTPGLSLLWSPSGQAVWDEMKAFHKVPAIELEPCTPVADVLNRFQWDAARTLPDGTLIFSGEDSEARRNEIRETLRKRIGPHASAMIGPYLPPAYLGKGVIRERTALFVSCLSHSPQFPLTFAKSKGQFRLSDGNQVPVQGLGCKGAQAAAYGDAVRVLADDLQGGCVLALALSAADKEKPAFLLVATRPGLASLGQAVEWMRETLKKPEPADKAVKVGNSWWRWRHELTGSDELWLPFLQTTLACDYGELVGKTYLRQRSDIGETFWRIREAQQLLSFRLNERGTMTQAVFKVVPDFLSVGGESGGLTPPEPKQLPPLPRRFLFNSPFVASLWIKGAEWPYLACWVDSKKVLAE